MFVFFISADLNCIVNEGAKKYDSIAVVAIDIDVNSVSKSQTDCTDKTS